MKSKGFVNYEGSDVFLNYDQKEKIVDQSLSILEEIGMIATEERAVERLLKAGAQKDGKKIKLPRSMVQDCISSTPKEITLYDQLGNQSLKLMKNNSYFGGLVDSPYIFNYSTNEYEVSSEKKVGELTYLIEQLPNIRFLAHNGFLSDKEESAAGKYAFRQCLKHSNKPIITTIQECQDLKEIVKMSEVVLGNDTLSNCPFLITYAEPISPLTNSDEAIKKVIYSAKKQIPVVYSSFLAMGATAPLNISAAISQAVAESLFGLVITQIFNKGAPFIMGGMATVMDMRTSIFPYGAPEMWLMCSSIAEIAEHLSLPSFGTGGAGDAKIFNGQAIFEGVMSSYMAIMAGADLVHDVALFGSGEIVIPDMLVLIDEMVQFFQHSVENIDVKREDFPLEVMDEVGPRGEYLTHEHTLDNFKSVWYPSLLERSNFNKKTRGSKSLEERTHEKLLEILSGYENKESTLNKVIIRELNNIQEDWY